VAGRPDKRRNLFCLCSQFKSVLNRHRDGNAASAPCRNKIRTGFAAARLRVRGNCQTACKPGSVRNAGLRRRPAATIPLGRASLRASRDQPGRRSGNAPASCPRPKPRTPAGRPYSVLLPVGFALPRPLPAARCALTAPFHPCLPQANLGPAVCFLWHFPWGRPRRPLAGTAFPWSPDFPPSRHLCPDSGRPAV
jgi:hypothetical protein